MDDTRLHDHLAFHLHMFSEFFCHADPRYRAGAWCGMIFVVAMVGYQAWISFVMNSWYQDFYDALQNGSKAIGDDDELDAALLHGHQDRIWDLIVQYLLIVMPLILVTPLATFLTSCWTYYWRVSIMRSYLEAWDVSLPPIEGAAQRVHEDTQRFAQGLNSLAGDILYAILTLVTFTPVLLSIGEEVTSPFRRWGIDLGDAWLLVFAWSCALGGLGVSIFLGRELIGLEVNNQKVEAVLRRDLVVLETTPEKLITADDGCAATFEPTLRHLTENYMRLFVNFTKLNAWLGVYNALIGLVPFVICAPLLFAPLKAERITLGTLTQLDNAFTKVFGALNTVSMNWARMNDFASCVIRLRQFEATLYEQREAAKAGLL